MCNGHSSVPLKNPKKHHNVLFLSTHGEQSVVWIEFCATDLLQHLVTSVQLWCPGPQTAAASHRRPSSQGETGSPRSSDNEHSSGRLQADVGRGESFWLGKSNKHTGLRPMLALRQSHIMTIQSHFLSLFLTTCFFWQQICRHFHAIRVPALHRIQISYELQWAGRRIKWAGCKFLTSKWDQKKCFFS